MFEPNRHPAPGSVEITRVRNGFMVNAPACIARGEMRRIDDCYVFANLEEVFLFLVKENFELVEEPT